MTKIHDIIMKRSRKSEIQLVDVSSDSDNDTDKEHGNDSVVVSGVTRHKQNMSAEPLTTVIDNESIASFKPPPPKKQKQTIRECSINLADCRQFSSSHLQPRVIANELNNNIIKFPIVKLTPIQHQHHSNNVFPGTSSSYDQWRNKEQRELYFDQAKIASTQRAIVSTLPKTDNIGTSLRLEPEKGSKNTIPGQRKSRKSVSKPGIPALSIDLSKDNESTANKKSRTVSSDLNEDAETSFIYHRLSERAKSALERIKKNAVKNPFNDDSQSLIDEFSNQVETQSHKDTDLSEAAVLLDGVIKVFNRQTMKLHGDMIELAEFINSKKPKERKERQNLESDVTSAIIGKRQLKESFSMEEDGCEETLTEEQDVKEINLESTGENLQTTDSNASRNESNVETSDGETLNSTSSDPVCDKTIVTDNVVLNEAEQNKFLESLVLDNNNCVEGMSTSVDSGVISEPANPNEFNSGSVVASTPVKPPASGPATSLRRRDSENPVISFHDLLNPSFFKLLGNALKKAKTNTGISGPPPTLEHYLDMPIIEGPDDEPPPILEHFNKFKRPRVVKEKHDKGNNDKPAKSAELDTPIVNKNADAQPQPATAVNNTVIDLAALIPKGADLKLSEWDSVGCDIKPEDLIYIHSFIQQLHYLTLATDLSSSQTLEVFTNGVKKLQEIFKAYNLRLDMDGSNRNKDECQTVTENSSSGSNDQWNLDSLHESLSESYQEDDNTTVMQRTKEKTRKESKKRLKEMLSSILSPIVRKHYNKALMDEHSETFFRTVEGFRKKMKKILEGEETRKQFELVKYEQEMLEVASKDHEMTDDGGQVSIPVSKPLSDQNEVTCTTMEFTEPQSPCRSESEISSKSSGSNGVKWIPLHEIFSHMKDMDGHEVSRYFCALLGLLSFQNLDMNYDKLYSDESAKKVKKTLDLSQDTKYPRGVQIVRSRCPDIDKDEIFVAAMSSVSRTETFRQLETGVAPEDIHRLSQEEFLQATNSLAAFEVVQTKAYEGELFSKRARAREENKKLQAAAAAAKSPTT